MQRYGEIFIPTIPFAWHFYIPYVWYSASSFVAPFRLVGERGAIFVEAMGRKFRPINIHRVGFLVDVGLSPTASPQPLP
jgi:hypothetical protein